MTTATDKMPQNKRMEWLDAMRGFTMILVVAHHVSTLSIGLGYKDSTTIPFLMLIRMPLFFFISGFLAYRPSTQWTAKVFGSSVFKKIRIQVLPTLVFFVIFTMMRHKLFWDSFVHGINLPYKNGYWFTWVLLHMFVIYYIFAYLEQKILSIKCLKIPVWLPIAVFWVLSLCWYETNYIPKIFKCPTADWANISSYNQVSMFFCFFVTGNVCRRYWKTVEKQFAKKWLFAVLVLVAVASTADFLKFHHLRLMWANLPRTMITFSMIGITIMYFHSKQRLFSKETRLGRTLQYIGTRTLDIYLIHYLYLPLLPMLKSFIANAKPNILIELGISFSIAIPIIALSLLTSSVLRTSPIFTKYLFGVSCKANSQAGKSLCSVTNAPQA